MTSIKLSAVIITKNEEKNIGRCIDSLATVADEIIIVDSFSTDGTESEVNKRGINLIQHEWMGYSETKNFANAMATGEFILSLDADEVLSEELIQSIDHFKKNPAEAANVNRLTNYCGKWIKHSGWYPEYKTRIFKKGAAYWDGTIHEELKFSSPPTKVLKLEGDLLHYSYPTVESHLKKMLPYAFLAAKKDFDKGKRYRLLTHGILKPFWMFNRKYFFNLGFLDGFYGFVIAMISSFERLLRYVKFRELQAAHRSSDKRTQL
jgi:glycosyltransferase involved in cell wall biosynthesis